MHKDDHFYWQTARWCNRGTEGQGGRWRKVVAHVDCGRHPQQPAPAQSVPHIRRLAPDQETSAKEGGSRKGLSMSYKSK